MSDAASVPASLTWAWLVASAAVAGATVVAMHALRARRRAQDEAFNARLDQVQWFELGEDWYWQTDREHRLQMLKAPAGSERAPPLAAWQGRPAWDVWQADAAAGALADRLALQGPVSDLACHWQPALRESSGAPESSSWTLTALPQHDRDGRFRGHLGRVRPLRAVPPPVGVDAHEGGGGPPAGTAVADEAATGAATFTYTVSHDLRAPIRVVEGFTRIVKEDYGHLLDRVGLDHLDRVLGAAARMNAMIDALLALSRLSQQPLERQPVNLSQLAGYILDDLQRAHPERRVEVHVEPGLTVQGDPTLLRIALENLLGNAWKYSAKQPLARIRFDCERRRTNTVYRVQDNGAGFDMRFADRLFGVFQRLHGASEFPGNGVGLASVRRIVRRHGGDIWAESVLGQGATFHFTLSPSRAPSPAH